MKRLLVFLGLAAAARFLLKRRIDDDAATAPHSFAPPPVPPAPAAKPAAEPEPPADEPEPPIAEPEPEPAGGEVAHGPGSAPPNDDGSAPEGFTIKGKATSRKYHTAESPYYKRTKADVWFREESDAEQAGFVRWDAKRKD
jgi:hypothetical protein